MGGLAPIPYCLRICVWRSDSVRVSRVFRVSRLSFASLVPLQDFCAAWYRTGSNY